MRWKQVLTNLPRFQGKREAVRTRLCTIQRFSCSENLRPRSFVLLDLLAAATADKYLLFAILMFTEGSHQVVVFWNHVSHWFIPVVLYGCVLAGVCNMARYMATSE